MYIPTMRLFSHPFQKWMWKHDGSSAKANLSVDNTKPWKYQVVNLTPPLFFLQFSPKPAKFLWEKLGNPIEASICDLLMVDPTESCGEIEKALFKI